MKYRIILNGKFSQHMQLREIIERLKISHDVDIRVSWSAGDMQEFAEEIDRSYERVIVAGGDGSINEVVNGLMKSENPPELAIIPLGTANDLALSARVPLDLEEAFEFAMNKTATDVDVIQVNDRYFLNAASLGQAAKVTERTPDVLKGIVGKYAYSLSSLISFFDTSNPVPFRNNLDTENRYIFGYICNGITCGGGFEISPDSRINDGFMDVLLIKQFDLTQIANVTLDLWQNNENEYIKRFKSNELYLESDRNIQVSLDGEIYSSNKFFFKCLNHSLKMVIGPESQLVAAPEEPDVLEQSAHLNLNSAV